MKNKVEEFKSALVLLIFYSREIINGKLINLFLRVTMWLTIQVLLCPLFFQTLGVLFLSEFQNKSLDQNSYETSDYTESESELTVVEKHQIELLRQLLGSELQLDFEKCDDFLIRWLQECDMDLPCAFEKVKFTLNWRRTVLVDIMRSNKTYLTSKQDPTLIQGRANDGGPIMLYSAKEWDIRKLVLSGNKENLIKHQTQLMEHYFQKSIWRTENGMTKLRAGIVISNFQGFSLKQHGCYSCIDLFRELTNICDSHYARTSKYLVVINGPTVATPFLQVIKSFLTPYIQESFRLFGHNKDEWSSFLLKYATKEELLEGFGGTAKRITF